MNETRFIICAETLRLQSRACSKKKAQIIHSNTISKFAAKHTLIFKAQEVLQRMLKGCKGAIKNNLNVKADPLMGAAEKILEF